MPYKGQKPCKCRSHHRPHLHAPCAIDLNAKTAAVAGALRIVRAEAACRKQGTTDQSIAAVRCSDSFIGTTLWAPPARARVGACLLMMTTSRSRRWPPWLRVCFAAWPSWLFWGAFLALLSACVRLNAASYGACLPACLPASATLRRCTFMQYLTALLRCVSLRATTWLAGWLAGELAYSLQDLCKGTSYCVVLDAGRPPPQQQQEEEAGVEAAAAAAGPGLSSSPSPVPDGQPSTTPDADADGGSGGGGGGGR